MQNELLDLLMKPFGGPSHEDQMCQKGENDQKSQKEENILF